MFPSRQGRVRSETAHEEHLVVLPGLYLDDASALALEKILDELIGFRETLMQFPSLYFSIREATLTVDPKMSYENLRLPSTPAMTGRMHADPEVEGEAVAVLAASR
jgi:hypothetical protein